MVTSFSQTAGQVLDALGDGTRRRIVELLAARARPVGAIARELPVSRPAVSKHLKQLEAAGLVSHRVVGREHHYALAAGGLMALRGELDALWDLALARFADAAGTPEENDR
jgi:DNA-binding transcriptional ArsR family regulator